MAWLIRSLDSFPSTLLGGAIAVGNFDGVHAGHRVLIRELIKTAKLVNGPSIVFTFDPPPIAFLNPGKLGLPLTTIERRAQLLHEAGIDFVVACPTNRELLELEPEAFFNQILKDGLILKGMVEGPNFRFGKDRRGDIELLEQLCKANQVQLKIVQAECTEGDLVSSSRIRSLIQSGSIEQANELLAKPYRLEGIVGKGARRGNTIGFPTANLQPLQVLAPAHGVYAGRCSVDGKSYQAAIHVGPNPTFGENQTKVEVHLLNFDGDLYGQFLSVELLAKIRDVQKFESVERLIEQLRSDCARASELERGAAG